jgi:hypothetical protein
LPILVFYIPPCEKKEECEQGSIELTSLGELILSYTPRLRLPCMRAQNIKY